MPSRTPNHSNPSSRRSFLKFFKGERGVHKPRAGTTGSNSSSNSVLSSFSSSSSTNARVSQYHSENKSPPLSPTLPSWDGSNLIDVSKNELEKSDTVEVMVRQKPPVAPKPPNLRYRSSTSGSLFANLPPERIHSSLQVVLDDSKKALPPPKPKRSRKGMDNYRSSNESLTSLPSLEIKTQETSTSIEIKERRALPPLPIKQQQQQQSHQTSNSNQLPPLSPISSIQTESQIKRNLTPPPKPRPYSLSISPSNSSSSLSRSNSSKSPKLSINQDETNLPSRSPSSSSSLNGSNSSVSLNSPSISNDKLNSDNNPPPRPKRTSVRLSIGTPNTPLPPNSPQSQSNLKPLDPYTIESPTSRTKLSKSGSISRASRLSSFFSASTLSPTTTTHSMTLFTPTTSSTQYPIVLKDSENEGKDQEQPKVSENRRISIIHSPQARNSIETLSSPKEESPQVINTPEFLFFFLLLLFKLMFSL